jgi:hypothetical protein
MKKQIIPWLLRTQLFVTGLALTTHYLKVAAYGPGHWAFGLLWSVLLMQAAWYVNRTEEPVPEGEQKSGSFVDTVPCEADLPGCDGTAILDSDFCHGCSQHVCCNCSVSGDHEGWLGRHEPFGIDDDADASRRADDLADADAADAAADKAADEAGEPFDAFAESDWLGYDELLKKPAKKVKKAKKAKKVKKAKKAVKRG